MSAINASTIVLAIVTFIVTNIDDFFVLVIYFSRAIASHDTMSQQQVITGQIIGFTFIVSISALGLLFGAFIPNGYVQLVGIVPFSMGCKKLYDGITEEWDCSCCRRPLEPGAVVHDIEIPQPPSQQQSPADEGVEEHEHDERTCSDDDNVHLIPLQLQNKEISPQHINPLHEIDDIERKDQIKREVVEEQDEEEMEIIHELVEEAAESWLAKPFVFFFHYCLNVNTLEVAAVVIANGGDNIAIYMPIFATASNEQIGITVFIWYVLLALWLSLTRFLVNFHPIVKLIETYGSYFLPFLFMGIGLYILSGCIIVTHYILHRD